MIIYPKQEQTIRYFLKTKRFLFSFKDFLSLLLWLPSNLNDLRNYFAFYSLLTRFAEFVDGRRQTWTFQTLPHVQRKGCRGCPTKHDSLWIVFNVFFHIMYYILLTFCSLFSFKNLLLKYILLWNQFYYNMADIEMFIFFSWGSNNLTNYGRRHFKVFTNCHVSWDTNFKWPPI